VQFFKEKDEVLALIAASCNASTEREFEAAHAELSKILLNYLEQSQLILPHVPDLVDPINQKLTSLLVSLEDSASEDAKAAAMRQLFYVGNVSYSLCRVAGYKYVMKHFLHEVSHLESCLSLLNQQDRADHRWETRYVLLLWLAALCLIPFDICSMDSSLQIEPSQPVDASDATEPSESIESSSVPGPPARTLVTNIVTQCKAFLSDTGPTREAAAVCLSCLLTRPDMENAHLQEFMQWSVQQLEEWAQRPAAERATLSADYFCVLGVFLSVFQVFKLGHRTKLLPYGPLLLPHCFSLSGEECQTSLRKLIAKLVQRIGMNFLPPRVAKWRYLRGNRSLTFGGAAAAAGAGGAVGAMGSAAAEQGETQGGEIQGGGAAEGAEEEEDEEEAEVPMLMDDVMEHLLCALRDKDTVVRWSAAKGIGRITMRLAQEFAKDVIDAVIDAFSDPEADSNWQGGCLALAELSRRGLLLPERLFSVIPFVERAIQFDVLRGQHSIGAHVRDAACYVCWAFCRAYSPLVMAPFIRLLTTSLLTTALYDREVNCRRAASAAYQETVGRQGDQNVPHGIEIITIADYFAVGNRNSSFTSIAAAVVTLDRKLHQFFLMHLRAVKLQHWDRDVRRLASKALAHLVPIDPQASVALLAELVPACSSPHLNTRHGSILATSEVLSALTNCGVSLSEQLCAAVVGVLPAIEKARLFRGRGGEQIREAVCELVQSVARSRVPMSVKLQVLYVESLNEHLKQPHESVQHAARDALRAFFHAYFSTGAPPSERLQKLTVLKYMEGLDSEVNVCATRGYALALGVLPLRLAASPPGRLGEVLAALGASSSPSKLVAGEYDANTCCNCVEALMELAERVAESPQLSALQVGQCFSLLFRASEDYSVDKRGDTGSWSRTMAL
ncbi:armadillo-type protein, partial [Ochromonadaceae sp. CCMP2298]